MREMPRPSSSDERCRDALALWLRSGTVPRPVDGEEAQALVNTAVSQGLAGLLDDALVADSSGAWPGESLVADSPGTWPEEALRKLRTAHRAALVLVLQRLTVASEILRALEDAGILSLALKGVALADTLYASPAHRPMDDVDLLILGDWNTACRVMADLGYVAEIQGDHAWGFRRGEPADSVAARQQDLTAASATETKSAPPPTASRENGSRSSSDGSSRDDSIPAGAVSPHTEDPFRARQPDPPRPPSAHRYGSAQRPLGGRFLRLPPANSAAPQSVAPALRRAARRADLGH